MAENEATNSVLNLRKYAPARSILRSVKRASPQEAETTYVPIRMAEGGGRLSLESPLEVSRRKSEAVTCAEASSPYGFSGDVSRRCGWGSSGWPARAPPTCDLELQHDFAAFSVSQKANDTLVNDINRQRRKVERNSRWSDRGPGAICRVRTYSNFRTGRRCIPPRSSARSLCRCQGQLRAAGREICHCPARLLRSGSRLRT